MLFKYMGDLYRDTQVDVGECSGAGSEQGEWLSAHSRGLFDIPRPASGFNLPSEFANESKRLENLFVNTLIILHPLSTKARVSGFGRSPNDCMSTQVA